jgi:hypothetical protein
MIFTGGAILLSGSARVDLLGSKVDPFLARWLHNTIHEKLLKLPDAVEVYPTRPTAAALSARRQPAAERSPAPSPTSA